MYNDDHRVVFVNARRAQESGQVFERGD